MLPNEKYIIYVPPPNYWFLFKIFYYFFPKICHKKNNIRRCKLRFYSCSTFLFENRFIKYKYVILQDHFRKFPRDFEILGWCPARPVLPHGEGEGASLALVGNPSSDGITIKMPYGVDVLHQPASHPIFSYWVG